MCFFQKKLLSKNQNFNIYSSKSADFFPEYGQSNHIPYGYVVLVYVRWQWLVWFAYFWQGRSFN